MAIDRQVIWVYQRHETYPNIQPGFAFASAAEKAAMVAADCAEDPRVVKNFARKHIRRVAPYSPP